MARPLPYPSPLMLLLISWSEARKVHEEMDRGRGPYSLELRMDG